jgi:hypothetical protein
MSTLHLLQTGPKFITMFGMCLVIQYKFWKSVDVQRVEVRQIILLCSHELHVYWVSIWHLPYSCVSDVV